MQTLHSRIEDQPNPVVQTWERNKEELKEAVSRYLPLLHRRAYRYLGNSHDAEDAVQDALLSAHKHLNQFKGSAKMTTWLTSIVTNSALTQLRRKPRQPHSSLDERLLQDHDENLRLSDKLVDPRPNPEDEYSMSELNEHLMQIVRELSPSLREIIQLRDIDGLTISEAAHYLEVPESTIKTRLSRARSQLKRLRNARYENAEFKLQRYKRSMPSRRYKLIAR
jgi:RNA polymerase sigma-70 factor (ECF subfamily)